MTAVLPVVLIVAAVVCVVIAIIFMVRAFQSRMQRDKAAYGVARIETRQSVFMDVLRSLAAVVVAIVILVIFFLVTQQEAMTEVEPEPTPAPLVVTSTATVAPVTDIATATSAAPVTLPTATPTVVITPSPTVPPADTATPELQTAVVTSGVGVWLRAEPNTESEQLEWVLEGTVLSLLDGEETNEEFVWQQVRTPTGSEGWVAVDFITLINP